MSLVLTAVLLLGNAFFVGAEFALIASRRTVLETQTDSRRVRWALSAMGQLPLMIAGVQLGITICTLGLGAVAEPAIAHLLEPVAHAAGVPEGAVHPVALIIALTFVTYMHTVFGEMVPKNLALAGPERSVVWLGPPMLAFCAATKPLLVAMKALSAWILRLFKIEAAEAVKSTYTVDEFAGLISESQAEGLLEKSDHARLSAALELGQKHARDAMRPWAGVTTVTDDTGNETLEALACSSGLSRFPVIARQGRRIRGFVHIKDVINVDPAKRAKALDPGAIRPLPAVPPDRSLGDLLLQMRRAAVHIVLVAEGGAPLGIVTLDDVLAALVGRAGSPGATRR
ncbi:hemolysin family protein [Phytomonospora endophytica]|uniref:CBS domain containing-hemolysin-like protein n=1 Tax=Phytomonospora endophytica TaxID=714109 RepID=A0A841FW05_9ACTN|nr:hemolysin family protein [Phytomonospora endophytica]MBB6039974.1 CBS domain containing-hemolysin-like protein [Phytomonospora endophytica]GIG69820.1 membrane protein [Phytomonospora endophytica]